MGAGFTSSGEAVEAPVDSHVVEPSGKRRVVMLVNRLNRGGGAERAMVALAAGLPRERFEVTVVTTRSGNGPLLQTMIAQGVRHVSLDRRGKLDVAPFRRLAALLRAEQTDILHAHMFGSNLWGTLLGRAVGVPVVVAQEQTWSYEGQPLRRFLDGRVIGRLADAFVAVSERDRARMTTLEGVPSQKIIVLPNPYVRRAREGSGDVRRALGIPDAVPLVATVAVMRPQKAHEVLLNAFAELVTIIPEAVLVIGGDGERRQALEQQARDLGIAEKVRFPGWWEDVGGLLEAADVAAMSSDYEGSPLFALECMAHGAPLVSTDVGNVAELLGDGQGVTVVAPRDASAMARALAALLRDPERRSAQARAAAERLPRYEVGSVTRDFIELYDRLFDATPRRRKRFRQRVHFPAEGLESVR